MPPTPQSTQEQNKEIVRKMLKAFNSGDTKAVEELLHPDIVDKSRAIGLEPEVRKQHPRQRVQVEMKREKEAFPDVKFKEESIVAEGDRVILRWSMTGTQKGPFVGRKATGKKVRVTGTEIVRIKDGKIIEHDDDPTHMLDLLRQLDMLEPEMLAKEEFQDDTP